MVQLKIQLPEGFLDEEERCGYVVSSQMKEVWAVELDLLSEFQRVCNKFNLKYYADAGTLLGAVRHNGFIPWDDDIDIVMPRDEYKKLCKIAPKEFNAPFFFQTNQTDPGSSNGHAQLRNNMTAAILGGKENVTNHNQGIFIDIFPIDVVPDNNCLRLCHKSLVKFFLMLYFFFGNCSVNYNEKDKRGKWKLRAFLNQHFNKLSFLTMNVLYKMYENTCALFNKRKSKYYSLLCLGYEKFLRQKTKYEQCVQLDFEFIKVPAPYLYEDVLDLHFGKWKKYVIGTSLHGSVFFDTNNSYKDYLNKMIVLYPELK